MSGGDGSQVGGEPRIIASGLWDSDPDAAESPSAYFWALVIIGSLAIVTLIVVACGLCCVKVRTGSVAKDEEAFGIGPSAPHDQTQRQLQKGTKAKKNLRVSFEHKYLDGETLFFDKRDLLVPKDEIVDGEGIIDVSRLHRQLGDPMASGFNRDTFMTFQPH